jgi:hypothetical protein
MTSAELGRDGGYFAPVFSQVERMPDESQLGWVAPAGAQFADHYRAVEDQTGKHCA